MSIRRVAIVDMFLESNAFARTVDERGFRLPLYLEGEEISKDARAEHPRQHLEVVGLLQRMPFERLPRPVYPLDQGFDWDNPLAVSPLAEN